MIAPDPEPVPDSSGHFGPYGGMFVPETLMTALQELEREYRAAVADPAFHRELDGLLKDYCGRPTPLYFAERLTGKLGGARIYLKREDLLHTGAHKINNAIGQILLARRMGKTRIIAETGAGQHGVATAAAAARFGFECVIYMGAVDMERQALNVARMKFLGAKVVSVTAGQATLKEAINEAMRDWVTNVRTTHYILGSALGSHPYPMIVRDFHKVIGEETRRQILEREGRLPDHLVACVGGGSNAIGFFYAFLGDESVRLTGVEAGGEGIIRGRHAARFQGGNSESCRERRRGFLPMTTARSSSPTRFPPVSTTRRSGRNTAIIATGTGSPTTLPPTTRRCRHSGRSRNWKASSPLSSPRTPSRMSSKSPRRCRQTPSSSPISRGAATKMSSRRPSFS